MQVYPPRPHSAATKSTITLVEDAFLGLIQTVPTEGVAELRFDLLRSFGSLAMEHLRAIVLLCDSQVAVGSALALFRPLLEAVVRGEWLFLCGSEDQQKRFASNELNLSSIASLNAMAEQIDQKADQGDRLSVYTSYYRQISDYSHGGHDAVYHRIGEDGAIQPSYPEERIRALLQNAAAIVIEHYAVVARWTHDETTRSAVGRILQTFLAAEPSPA